MSPHQFGYYALLAAAQGGMKIRDPGDGLTFTVNKSFGVAELTLATGATETRLLPSPTSGNGIGVGTRMTVTLPVYDSGSITITDGFSNAFVFDAAGATVSFMVVKNGTALAWQGQQHLQGITASAAELNTLDNQTLTTGAGAGITSGTGTIYKNAVQKSGEIFSVRILIDLTGLASSTTDLDIIGNGASAAYIALLTAASAGTTILTISMTCLEAPAGGVTDIDLYSAVESTGVFDGLVTSLTETALITSGGAWTNGTTKAATVVPAATEYLYLTCGAAGTVGTYTAGKFLITILGY